MSNNGQYPNGQGSSWEANNDAHEAPTQQASAADFNAQNHNWADAGDAPTQMATPQQAGGAYGSGYPSSGQGSTGYPSAGQSGQAYGQTSYNSGQTYGSNGQYNPAPSYGSNGQQQGQQSYDSNQVAGQTYGSNGQDNAASAYGANGQQQYGQGGSSVQQPYGGYDQNAAYGAAGASGYPTTSVSGGSFASWGSRFVAYLVDTIIGLVPFYILYALGMWLAVKDATTYTNPDGTKYTEGVNGLGLAIVGLASLALLAYSIWNFGMKQGKTGQSIGKKMMKIAVVDHQTGQPIGVGRGIGRMFAQILNGLPCYIGYLWPLWDDKKQSFADKVMNTLVIEKKA